MAELINDNDIEVTPEEDALFDGWDDDETYAGFDDEPTDGTEDVSTDEADADQQTAEGEETEAEETGTEPVNETAESTAPETAETPTEDKTEAETPQTDQSVKYTLKHLDDTKEVTAEEMIPLAQKGMDYDRIREERDTMRAEWARLKELEKFANELYSNSKGYDSIEALIDDTRAEFLIKSEANYGRPLAKKTALERVKQLREDSIKANTPKAEPKVPTEKEQAEARDKSIEEFCKAYPTVDAKQIPQSVYAEFRKTGDLLGAYRNYEKTQLTDKIASLEKEIATLKTNKKNEARSTGSMKSAGKADKGIDPMFEGWDD